ncbi:MAG TPA: DUF2235 domain-containing protein [Sphingomicrobium sp.]
MAPGASDAKTQAKSIILFSDGTGNSSAKLFKTNVWRLYEAVDLGPAEAGKPKQIAFYDDGVGSSSFRPLSFLGGIFGQGLKRNVLQLYGYVCRNYDPHSQAHPNSKIEEPGDHIYGFGFSRGAFTMRLVIAMIADQGIIPYTGKEADLQRKVELAYKDFRRSRKRRAFQFFRELSTKYDEEQEKDRFSARLKQRTGYDRNDNHRPVIRFIGVWDTVAAYGGPIVEITRAVDNWFYPLSMPDYKLSKHVRRARHALALDDERDSFWPLLWDEIAEKKLRDSKPKGFGWIDKDRLRQVWFTGMHADVGGGYPDESLSYVSLLWMIAEAQECELRTVDSITQRYRSLVNSYGPIHDSRAGIGAYYRYQPRKIAAWLEPVRKSTLSLRDPDIQKTRKEKEGRVEKVPKGLIRKPLIHESAIARMASGTDGYAPIVLPDDFAIFPDISRETAPLETSGGPQSDTKDAGGKCPPLLDPEVRALLGAKGAKKAIAGSMESAWDFVWRRRIAYFLNVGATVTLFGWPWIAGRAPNQFAEAGADPGSNLLYATASEWLGKLITLITAPLPNITSRWTDAWAASPIAFLILAGVIFFLRWRSASLEMKLRDESRRIWNSVVPRVPPPGDGKARKGPGPHAVSRIEWFRNSAPFQRGLQVLKWGVLPNIFALLMALSVVWLFSALVTQVALPYLETGESLCPTNDTGFATNRLCNNAQYTVRKDEDYVITFEVTSDWKDGSYLTDPRGVAAGQMRWLVGYLGAPFRRVIGARYLQPVAEVRWSETSYRSAGAMLQALDVEPVPEDPTRFQARFTPRASGQLYLFSNDAVSLVGLHHFYTSRIAANTGTAKVTIEQAKSK